MELEYRKKLDKSFMELHGIDDDSVFVTYVEDGVLHIILTEDRIEDDEDDYADDSPCCGCEYYCEICGRCVKDD